MKLYTEEQVLNALRLAHSHIKPLQYVVDTLKSIELPSDEEIEKQSEYIAHNYFDMHNTNHYQGLKEGSFRMASWMRDKILNK